MIKTGDHFARSRALFLLPLLFGLLLSFSAEASVKIQAFADRKEMGLGDTLDVTVQVSSSESVEVGEPNTQGLTDFQIVNTFTSTSTSSKLVQGPSGMEFQTQRSVEYHFMISPKREGNLPIPAFEVSVDGKTFKTVPFTVRVSGAGSGSTGSAGRPDEDEVDEAEKMFNQLLQRHGGANIPKPGVAPKNPNESFFLHLDLDKTEVYEGEQITANWYIYTRGNILALDRLKFPDLAGFWKEIIEEVPALNFAPEVLNGVSYRKALLASHALFPTKSGTGVIDEFKVKATVQLPSGTFGVFGFGEPYTYTRSSDRVKIKVKPLPTEGRPADFAGGVGQFEVQASVDNPEVPINQPFALKVRFEGEGNAKLIDLPTLNLPTGLENYDTKSDAKFFKNGRSFKEFIVLIIPRDPGDIDIPALGINLFDPTTGKYYTKKTDPIHLKVTGTKSAETPGTGATTNSGGDKTSGAASGETAKPGLPAVLTTYESTAGLPLGPMPWLGGLTGLSLVLLGWKARRELGRKEKKATIQELLAARMKKVHKSEKTGNWRDASTQMMNVIYSVLGAISGEGGANKELRVLLEKAPPSLRRDLGEELSRTVDLFQLLSFAPEEAMGRKKDPAELHAEIQKAEKLLIKAIEHIDSDEAQT